MAEAILTAAGETLSPAEHVRRLRQAMLDTMTVEDMVAITRKLIEKACEGCKQCLKLVLSYFLGRPGPVPLGLTMADDDDAQPAPAPADTVTKRVVTAAAAPPAPPLTPEMERFLSQPFSAAELDEARRISIFERKPPKANGK